MQIKLPSTVNTQANMKIGKSGLVLVWMISFFVHCF